MVALFVAARCFIGFVLLDRFVQSSAILSGQQFSLAPADLNLERSQGLLPFCRRHLGLTLYSSDGSEGGCGCAGGACSGCWRKRLSPARGWV